MPQKKNPDLAELSRGKSARVLGNLMALLSLLKGLPMTYNRDLQEDKERLFDTADTVRSTARIMAAMLNHCTVNTAVCDRAARDPALLATDLADWLVLQGLPFREAHHIVGQVVAEAERRNKPLSGLTLAELRSLHPAFNEDALAVFDLDRAMQRRRLPGSPGIEPVRKQLTRWCRHLDLAIPPPKTESARPARRRPPHP